MTEDNTSDDEATEAEFVVYGGIGNRRLLSFTTRERAEKYAAGFEQQCWSLGVAVSRSIVEEAK